MDKILLMIARKENSRLLADLLKDRYKVRVAGNDKALDGSFDLCILDGVAMERLWEKVKKRKEEEEPLMLPFLVTTTRSDARLTTRRLWQTVDDLVKTPIDKREILAQVEVLLRARKLSRESMWSYDALARNVPGAVFIIQGGKIVYANPLARQMGNLGEKVMGTRFIELFHPGDRESLLQCHNQAMIGETAAGETAACETRYAAGDQVRYADVRLVPISYRRKPAVLGIALDITDRKLADIELRKHRDHLEDLVEERTMKLEEKNVELEEFAFKVSHELKNNLVVIKRFTELAVSDPGLIREKSSFIMDSSDRLLDYIDKTLKLARTGKSISEKKDIEVEPFIMKIFKRMKPPGVKCRLSVRGPCPSVLADPAGLEQVFSNLIGNSVKYRDPGKKLLSIEVGCTVLNGSMELSFRDNGSGIAGGDLDRVFELAFTAEESYGFGLTIARKIVEAHGGSIRAESKGKGAGATFIITLPGVQSLKR